MSEYESLHQRLLEEGYIADNCFKDKTLPEDLVELALDLARGNYQKVKIIPADLALHGVPRVQGWVPAEQYHLVYAVLGEEEAKHHKEEGLTTIVSLRFLHKDTHEVQSISLPKK